MWLMWKMFRNSTPEYKAEQKKNFSGKLESLPEGRLGLFVHGGLGLHGFVSRGFVAPINLVPIDGVRLQDTVNYGTFPFIALVLYQDKGREESAIATHKDGQWYGVFGDSLRHHPVSTVLTNWEQHHFWGTAPEEFITAPPVMN